MSELKRHHINEVMDMHNLTKGELGYSYVYYEDDVDKVIEEKDKEIAELIEKNKRLARKDMIMASETIKDLVESHKKEVGQLLMEISELKETLNNSRNARKYWRKEYLIEYKECCSQKYKRCLAMAKIFENKLGTVVKPGWWDKWRRRWLELAEKFKEAK